MDAKIPIRVLIVEDSDDDTQLLMGELKRGGYEPSYLRIETPEALQVALDSQEWDIIFGDHNMPNFSGIRALAMIRARGIDAPFIFVSGTIGEDTAVEAMKSGAQDYLMKGNLKRLLPAVGRELRDAVMRRERRQAEERLNYLAHYDILTGLPNRALFGDRLEQAIHEARRHERLVSVAFLDLDRFKAVNDSMGHEAGDMLLKDVAQRLAICIRTGDTVARLSGDEFTFLLADMAHANDASRVVRKILSAFAKPFEIAGRELYISASLGVALFPLDSDNGASLLRNADIAMYRAKDTGGNSYHFYTREMTERAIERLGLESALRRAIDHADFTIHYQPQVEATNGHIVSVEALLRWDSREHGSVPPDRFIPLAEETGLIMPIGEWVLRVACTEAKRWLDNGAPSLRIAVNFSAYQFRQKGLVDLIRSVLGEVGLDPSQLEMEITESVLMHDVEPILTTLHNLRGLGIRISLDDFGTGYSSLSYLKRFPLDCLKIDRSFIRCIPADPDDTAIASAIIAMARRLNIDVVAEGVETKEQFEFLRTEGCSFMQGHFLQRPAPAEQILSILQEKRSLLGQLESL